MLVKGSGGGSATSLSRHVNPPTGGPKPRIVSAMPTISVP